MQLIVSANLNAKPGFVGPNSADALDRIWDTEEQDKYPKARFGGQI